MTKNTIIYSNERGLDSELEFQGIKGRYVWWLFIGLTAAIVLAMLIMMAGSDTLAILVFVGSFIGIPFYVIHMNRTYGRWGMVHKRINAHLPQAITLKPRHSIIKRS
ncbi:MAG: DUF4133 domain-containing protein [Tunicatimonas sp.]|uniref:DUF4133 domain-containing protein n=1 Tax=Tunicatimonas sp. TaxID=1940096 RepID=UPI003C748436